MEQSVKLKEQASGALCETERGIKPGAEAKQKTEIPYILVIYLGQWLYIWMNFPTNTLAKQKSSGLI